MKSVSVGPPTKKNKIVQAAIKCFVKSGVAQTKIKDIAEKAGIDQPLVNYYFPSLDSLYIEVIQEILRHLNDHVMASVEKSARDPKAALQAYVLSYFEWPKKNPGLGALWLYFYHLASFSPAFTQLNDLIRRAGRERIAALLYQGMEKKLFKIPEGLTVSELSLTIQALLTGNTVIAGTESSKDWAQASRNTLQTLSLLLGADFETR